MKLIFATRNSGKLREAAEILGDGVRLLAPQDLGIEGEAEETEKTFAGNSLLKARYIWDRVFGMSQRADSQGGLRTVSQASSPAVQQASPQAVQLASSKAVRQASPLASADGGREIPSADDIVGVFADDSGLETDALGGEPGVYTARYAGGDKNFSDNMDKLLRRLEEAGADSPEARSARFRCVVTLIFRDGRTAVSEGSLEGRIATARHGGGGFGYDPVFIPADSELAALSSRGVSEEEIAALRGRTLAEIPENVKNLISHRFKALAQMTRRLGDASGTAATSVPGAKSPSASRINSGE